MSTNLDIRLKRPSKTYVERDILSGVLRLENPSEFKHEGIILTMYGDVTLECSPRNPIQLVFSPVDICRAGKIPSGVTEIPFEIPLEACPNRKIYQTYHGVYLNIRYKLKCDIRRGFLGKSMSKEIEFIVEEQKRPLNLLAHYSDRSVSMYLKPLDVVITPSTLRSAGLNVQSLPNFKINVHLDSVVCKLDAPLTGTLMFEKGTVVLKSVELQLVRVEACNNTKADTDRTEIQNLQIVDGNVPDKFDIPIHMPFPKLFTCPTIKNTNFSIEFEANLIIAFKNHHLINENICLTLVRD